MVRQVQAQTVESGNGDKRYDVRVIFGRRDDPLLLVYARQLIEQISMASDLPLLLSISLTVRDRPTVKWPNGLNGC
jgi:proteasome assembly chaperone 3